jgi:aspartate aminotransferase
MFEGLPLLPSDPILGLSVAFRDDPNPNKVDLGVGVYRNDAGETPIMAAVAAAEQERLRRENSKAYTFPAGYPGANDAVNGLLLGAGHPALAADRVRSIQTPGGCGALRVAAELIRRARPEARVWVSIPSWANHVPLLGGAGLTMEEYPYYDYAQHALDFEAMVAALSQVPAGDVVLFHASCHNPSGADLSQQQWQRLTELALERGFVPLIDSAYQGLGEGLEEDAFGPRLMSGRLPEVIIASSFSKNFGLYRDRAGALTLVNADAAQSQACHTQLLSITRGLYSMPPAHGSAIVDIILHSPDLTRQWRDELAHMRDRIQGLRQALVAALAEHLPNRDFSFIARERGMFSFLGLSEDQVARLRNGYSIYMTANSRINVAGLTDDTLDYVGGAIARVVGEG